MTKLSVKILFFNQVKLNRSHHINRFLMILYTTIDVYVIETLYEIANLQNQFSELIAY